MKLTEYQGKRLFLKYDIPVPSGFVVSSVEELEANMPTSTIILKAQILSGKRKKRGAIIEANPDNVKEAIEGLLDKKVGSEEVKQILVEQKLEILEEYYLSMSIDRANKNILIMFSDNGGIDIEETAKQDPDSIIKINFFEFNETDLKNKLAKFKHVGLLVPLIAKLHKHITHCDSIMSEINPLVLVGEELIAADSKVIIDDNAIKRHPECKTFREEIGIPEPEAINYVELDGDIGIVGNGAGLVMATLDSIAYFGGKPANFLDLGGGTGKEELEKAFDKVINNQNVKVLFVNIFGGITRCDEIAQGIIDYKNKTGISIPMFVRMIGTNDEEGKAILKQNGIETYDSMEECAKNAVEALK